MADYEVVSFDLDGTLCVHDRDGEAVLEAAFERAGVDPFCTAADLAAVDTSDLPTAHSDREFYENLFRAAARRADADPSLAEPLARAHEAVFDETAVSFRPGAERALEYALDHYQVALVTNGSEATQTAKLERLDIADAFDTAVFCDPAAGVAPKPDSAPMERMLEAVGTDPDRTVHVGDSHGADVTGAVRVGMDAAWVPRETTPEPGDWDPEPTYTLDSMRALPDVL